MEKLPPQSDGPWSDGPLLLFLKKCEFPDFVGHFERETSEYFKGCGIPDFLENFECETSTYFHELWIPGFQEILNVKRPNNFKQYDFLTFYRIPDVKRPNVFQGFVIPDFLGHLERETSKYFPQNVVFLTFWKF